MGTTNLAFYRVVVADARSPRDGRFIEILGHYDPNKDGTDNIVIKPERLAYWLQQGAEISQALRPLLKRGGYAVALSVPAATAGAAETPAPAAAPAPETPVAAAEPPPAKPAAAEPAAAGEPAASPDDQPDETPTA
jgi:small subunit ribosomal protein S16